MSTTTNTTASRLSSVGYKSRDFQQDTYKAYLSYLHAVEQPSKANDLKAFNAFKAIAVRFGYEVDYYADFVHGLSSYMETYTSMTNDPTHKVKSLSSFRQLFTRDILARIKGSSVSYSAPKAPKAPAKKAPAKKQPTAKEIKVMADELARAKALLVKMGVYAAD